MTRRVSICILVAALLVPALAAACPPTGEPFAKVVWLLGRREPFQASAVLHDALYQAKTADERKTLLHCLTTVYLQAGQWPRARAAWMQLADVVGQPRPAWQLSLAEIDLRAGDLDAALPELPAAVPEPWQVHRQHLAAIADLRRHDWPTAQSRFEEVAQNCGKATLGPVACSSARRNAVLLQEPPQGKSAGLATALSAVVPGAGFLYAGSGVDALFHGGSTLLLGWLTWSTHRADRPLSDQPMGTYVLAGLALFAYGANVVASHDTAQRRSEVDAWRFEQGLLAGIWPQPLALDASPAAALH